MRPYVVRLMSVGAPHGSGFETINDYLMSDGSIETMSSAEARKRNKPLTEQPSEAAQAARRAIQENVMAVIRQTDKFDFAAAALLLNDSLEIAKAFA